MPLGAMMALSAIACIIIMGMGYSMLIATFYKKVESGKALVRTGKAGIRVSFDGIMIIPILHRMECVDISMKSIDLPTTSFQTADKKTIHADINFQVNLHKTENDVVQAVQTYTCKTINNVEELHKHLIPQFTQATKEAVSSLELKTIEKDSYCVSESIQQILGPVLNGLNIDSCSITNIETINN